MIDERQDSIRQGIGVPAESEIGQAAARHKAELAKTAPPLEGGIGGTSDSDSAPEEAEMNRALREAQEAAKRSAG